MSRPVVNPGTLHWSGEHWINYLREPGSEKNSAMISLYHTRYSSAGEGTVAFIDIAGRGEFLGLYSDNLEVAEFIKMMIMSHGNPFDRPLPFYEARISRSGDIRDEPAWEIQAGEQRFVASWQAILPPIIVEGAAPTFGLDRDFFTNLFFARSASISVNGQLCPGEPYERDIWAASIGGRRSSCVFALAESMILASS